MLSTTKALLCCTLLVFVFVDIEVVTAMPLEMAETQPQQIVVDDMVLNAVPAKSGNTDMYMLMPENRSDDANDGESELTQNIIESQQQQQQVADEAGTAEAASDMLMMESNDEPVQLEIVQAPGQSPMPLAEQIQMAKEVVQALNDDENPEPAPLVQDEPEKAAETQQQVASMEIPALEMLPMPEALIATENSSINEEAIDAPTQSLETQSVSDVIANAIDTIEQQIQAEQQLNDETANEDDLPQQQNDKISLQLFDLPTESEESAADDAKAESDLEAAAAAAAAAAKPVEAEATAGNSLSELVAEAGESFMQALDNMLPEEVAEQQAGEEEKKQEEVEQQQQDDADASETQNVEQIVEAAKEELETAAKESEQAPEAAMEAQAVQQSQPEPTQAQEIEQAPQQMELTEQINKEEPKESVAEMEQEVAAVDKQESSVEAEVAEVAEEKVPPMITQNDEEPQQQQQTAEVMPAEQSQAVAAESQVQEEIVQPVVQAPMQADEEEAQAAPEAQKESEMEVATPIEVQQVLEEIESEQENAQQNDEEPLILMPAEPEQMEQVQQVMQVISEAMAEAQNAEAQVVEEQPQGPQQPAASEVAVEQVKVEMPEDVKVAEQQQANEETVAEAAEEPQEATIGVEFGVPEVASAAQSEVSMESLPAVAADEPVEEMQQEKVEAEELAPLNEQQVPKEVEPVANEIESNAIAETAAEAAEAEVAAELVQQDAEVAEEQQAVAQTLVDAINLVESLESAQAVEDNKIEEQPTVEQLAPVEPAAAAQEPQATEQQQSEVATSEAETPVESLMDDTQPAPEEATAPQQQPQQPTELTSEQLLTTIVQLPAALQQTEVEKESQVPLAVDEAQQDDTNTQPQTVRDENLLASEPQQQITEQQQAATAAVAAAAIESSSTANVQQQQPLNVADSVLNYVNASFIQQQQQQTQQQQMQQQIQQQIQQAINNNLSNNNSNKKQQQQQPTENNNNQDDDNKVTSHLRRYDGAQVWRIVVQNDRDKKLADELQSKYDGQLWKEVKQEVDYLLKPQVLAAAERHVRAANLSRIVLIDNLQRVIEVENPTPAEIAQLQNRKGHRLTWQAYHRLEDIHGFFDYLAKTYPDICSVETIGYSIEKRPLKILKVSNGNSSNPGIWMDGGMHAREWISPATVTYIANQIVEGWDDLPAYMRNINWYIHAVANPDGYEYSHTTDRLWRKNMRSHGRQCPGVDLNRNFGYKWGGKGTSANPCSQTYRGSKAFSEPETFYISKFISNFPRGTFQSYLSFHSYGQYVLFPWGYDYLQAADHNDLDRVARQAGSIITKSTGTKYTVGSSANTLYPAAGGSDDWAKGIAGIKYSYTIEMGDSGRYGFVLPASFIQTNGKDGYTFVDTVARSIVMKGNDKLRRRRS